MASKKSTLLTDQALTEIAQLFSALSDPSRLKLLRLLMEGPSTVSELVQSSGMKQGNVSKHLGILLAANILSREQQGNFAVYAIVDDTIHTVCEIMCQKLERHAKSRVKAYR